MNAGTRLEAIQPQLISRPTDAAELAERGELRRKARQYEDALADFDRALSITPQDPWILARHASVRLALAARAQRAGSLHAMDREALKARYAPILADLDRALDALPDDLWIRCQRVETLRCMKAPDAVRDECTRVLARKPGFPWAYLQRAWASRWMLLYDDALADVDQVIAREPEDAAARAFRALIYGQMRRTSDSLAEFTRAMERDAALATRWSLERGVVHLYAGHYDDALCWFERGRARPDAYFATYLVAITKALRSGVASASREIAEAEDAARAMLATEARAFGKYALTGLLRLKGDTDAALPMLCSALGDGLMLIEAALYDPIVRPLCAYPRPRAAIFEHIENAHPAMRYLGLDLPNTALAPAEDRDDVKHHIL